VAEISNNIRKYIEGKKRHPVFDAENNGFINKELKINKKLKKETNWTYQIRS
jgi:hypothetical protein